MSEHKGDADFRAAFSGGASSSGASSAAPAPGPAPAPAPPLRRAYDAAAFVVTDEAVRLANAACAKAADTGREKAEKAASDAPIPPDRGAFFAAQLPKQKEKVQAANAALDDATVTAQATAAVDKMFAGVMQRHANAMEKHRKVVASQATPVLLEQAAKMIILQSLGDAFEDMVWPQMIPHGAGGTIYHGLKLGASNELDFVIIKPGAVEIVSAKLDARQFDPNQDLMHWAAITASWASKGYTHIGGPDVDAAPAETPSVTNVALRDFNMTTDQFLDMVKPDWKRAAGLPP